MQPEQIKALDLRLTGCDGLKQAMERVEFIKFFGGKAFRLEPECERVSDYCIEIQRRIN